MPFRIQLKQYGLWTLISFDTGTCNVLPSVSDRLRSHGQMIALLSLRLDRVFGLVCLCCVVSRARGVIGKYLDRRPCCWCTCI